MDFSGISVFVKELLLDRVTIRHTVSKVALSEPVNIVRLTLGGAPALVNPTYWSRYSECWYAIYVAVK